jgi:8-oxo-dGTP pyrophosphatase MutT (NUDIX family)
MDSTAGKRRTARRVQYGALPYRLRGISRPQVMLITSRETGRWVIPKGWPQKWRKPYRAAAREAREEAGLVGKVGRVPIGSYSYRKRLKSGNVVACEVRVFPFAVKRRLKGWREKAERKVKWFSPKAAAKLVNERALRDIIRRLPKR